MTKLGIRVCSVTITSQFDFCSGLDADLAYQWNTKQTVGPSKGMRFRLPFSSILHAKVELKTNDD